MKSADNSNQSNCNLDWIGFVWLSATNVRFTYSINFSFNFKLSTVSLETVKDSWINDICREFNQYASWIGFVWFCEEKIIQNKSAFWRNCSPSVDLRKAYPNPQFAASKLVFVIFLYSYCSHHFCFAPSGSVKSSKSFFCHFSCHIAKSKVNYQ